MKAIVFLFASLTLMLGSCRMYKEVEVRQVMNVQILEFSNQGAECDIEIQVFNPNQYKITLTQSEVDLFFEGKYLGKVMLKEKLELPKNAVSNVNMKCLANTESVDGILANVLTLLFKSEYVMEAKGYVKGRALMLSRKFPVEFKEKLTREDLGF